MVFDFVAVLTFSLPEREAEAREGVVLVDLNRKSDMVKLPMRFIYCFVVAVGS